jgi:hypothetical protein
LELIFGFRGYLLEGVRSIVHVRGMSRAPIVSFTDIDKLIKTFFNFFFVSAFEVFRYLLSPDAFKLFSEDFVSVSSHLTLLEVYMYIYKFSLL